MGTLVKSAALAVGVACAVWLAVLWQWSASQYQPATQDIVLKLGLLPLVAVVAAFGLRWAWGASHRAQLAKAQALADSQAAGAVDSPAPPPTAEQLERALTFRLLGSHLQLPAGDSAADVLQALQEGSSTPDLDPELTDADGMPIFSARLAQLDVAALQDSLQPMVDAVRQQAAQPWSCEEPQARTWRALAAAEGPLNDALLSLHDWPSQMQLAPEVAPRQPPGDALDLDLSPAPAANGKGADASTPASTAPAAPPIVRIIVGMPVGSTAFELALAERWAQQRALDVLALPADRLVVQARALNGPALWERVEYTLMALHREAQQDVLVVLATHSDLDDARVQQLEDQQLLFHAANRARGLVPGEGAVALVVAGHAWPAAGPDEPALHLHRAAVVNRDKPIDAPGRTDGDAARTTFDQALAAASTAGIDVAALVTDGDRNTARNAEAFAASMARLPHLDAADQVLQLGAAVGHLGAAGFLGAVAVAGQLAKPGQGPVLALSQADATRRLSLLVRHGPGRYPDLLAAAQAGKQLATNTPRPNR